MSEEFMKKAIIKIAKVILKNSYRLRDYCIYTSGILPRPKYNKKYKIAICAIFKNEARFLKEWIEYHSMLGVEHFYLYNNNSTDNFLDVLSEYIESGLVSLKDWPYNQAQIEAYKDFYDNHWDESQWISFLDIDEFFVPKIEKNLIDWIRKNDKYPVLLIYWKMVGSSSILEHDDNKLCIEQYVHSWDSLFKCGKCIVNTDYQIASFKSGTHHATLTKSTNRLIPFILHPVDQFHHVNVSDTQKIMRKSKSEKASIQINHYWSKGWDVYNKKRSWDGDVFYKINPKKDIFYFVSNEILNTSTDYSIHRFLLMLKWKILRTSEAQEMETNNNYK